MSEPSPPAGRRTPATSAGRWEPRWSVFRPPLVPWSSAGLDSGIAIVFDGPPLSRSGPSCGIPVDPIGVGIEPTAGGALQVVAERLDRGRERIRMTAVRCLTPAGPPRIGDDRVLESEARERVRDVRGA